MFSLKSHAFFLPYIVFLAFLQHLITFIVLLISAHWPAPRSSTPTSTIRGYLPPVSRSFHSSNILLYLVKPLYSLHSYSSCTGWIRCEHHFLWVCCLALLYRRPYYGYWVHRRVAQALGSFFSSVRLLHTLPKAVLSTCRSKTPSACNALHVSCP